MQWENGYAGCAKSYELSRDRRLKGLVKERRRKSIAASRAERRGGGGDSGGDSGGVSLSSPTASAPTASSLAASVSISGISLSSDCLGTEIASGCLTVWMSSYTVTITAGTTARHTINISIIYVEL